jgi:periplasmic protein TonB
MSSIALHHRSTGPPVQSAPGSVPLPTLFGAGYGAYKTRKSSFVLSFLGQTLAIAAFLLSSRFLVAHRHEIRRQVIGIVPDVSPYILHPSASKSGGGGGGGDRDKLQASKGILPRFSREQLTPPMVVIRNANPNLPVEPTVAVPPEIHIAVPQTGSLGDPLSSILGPPSNGTGSGGGIGSGSGGGVGSGHGPGVGPGWGGGIGGGVYHVGGGITAPHLIYGPEPEFSEEARKAKYQGTVVLEVVVGTDGRTHNIRVAQSLGMGLDEKAIEAIRQWKFEPSRKDGIPVAVLVDIEVDFHLY